MLLIVAAAIMQSGELFALLLVLIFFVAPTFLLIRITRRLSPRHRIFRGLIIGSPTVLFVIASMMTCTRHLGPPTTLPEFPWPPPVSSARVSVPRIAFKACQKFGDLTTILDQALSDRGYVEKSYYAVPGGIAIVTRLERIYPDGRPFEPSSRWLLQDGYLQNLSPTAYLQALFTVREGYYRLIVFIVTDIPFGAKDGSITSDQATSLLAHGYNMLPESIVEHPLPSHYTCTALIYEFERGRGQAPVLLLPSRLDARTHLLASGLWSTLVLKR